METGTRREYTLVYDGVCDFCRRSVRAISQRDRDGRFELRASQDPGVMKRFPWIPASDYAGSLQLIRSDGRRWQGAAAVEEIVRVLPHGKQAAWIFNIPFVRPLAERLYAWVARNRHRFRCDEHCSS